MFRVTLPKDARSLMRASRGLSPALPGWSEQHDCLLVCADGRNRHL